MKNVFWSFCVVLGLWFPAFNNHVFAAETKEVCHDKTDKAGKPVLNKDGTPKQDCKKIKIHKKLEGTEVPVKK
jgi:hypothetical protein